MAKKQPRVSLQCTACKQVRAITVNQFAKGQPFCPRCGNLEVVLETKK